MAGAHIHRLQRFLDAAVHFVVLYAQILQSEGNLLLHHRGDDLIVGVLKDHAHLAVDLGQVVVVFYVQSADGNASFIGNADPVEMLCKGGFPAPVVPENGDELALLHRKGNVLEYGLGILCIAEGKVFCFNDRHGMFPPFEVCAWVISPSSGRLPRRGDSIRNLRWEDRSPRR